MSRLRPHADPALDAATWAGRHRLLTRVLALQPRRSASGPCSGTARSACWRASPSSGPPPGRERPAAVLVVGWRTPVAGCSAADHPVVAARLRDACPHAAGCGLGLALWDDTEDRGTLLRRADRLLYADKSGPAPVQSGAGSARVRPT
jgi:hypothetical protein